MGSGTDFSKKDVLNSKQKDSLTHLDSCQYRWGVGGGGGYSKFASAVGTEVCGATYKHTEDTALIDLIVHSRVTHNDSYHYIKAVYQLVEIETHSTCPHTYTSQFLLPCYVVTDVYMRVPIILGMIDFT